MSDNWSVKVGNDGRWEVDYGKAKNYGFTGNLSGKFVASPQPSLPFTTVNEQTRTYTFADGSVTLEGVVSISVGNSGTHRINTKDGKKHIISPGWLHIEFDAPYWTF